MEAQQKHTKKNTFQHFKISFFVKKKGKTGSELHQGEYMSEFFSSYTSRFLKTKNPICMLAGIQYTFIHLKTTGPLLIFKFVTLIASSQTQEYKSISFFSSSLSPSYSECQILPYLIWATAEKYRETVLHRVLKKAQRSDISQACLEL